MVAFNRYRDGGLFARSSVGERYAARRGGSSRSCICPGKLIERERAFCRCARDGRLLAGTASGVGLPADDDPSLPDGASSGACGEDATWAFDASTRTLTISGTGSVSDNSGWLQNAYLIKGVVVEEGITAIGRASSSSVRSPA